MSTLTRRYHVPSAIRRSSFRVDAENARALLRRGGILVDVRRQQDPTSPLAGAVRIPPDLVTQRLRDLPGDAPIVLACSCLREASSVRVAYFLRDRGFEAYAVRGGVPALLGRTQPVARKSERDRPRAGTTLAALRHRRFRRFSAGTVVSQTGSWVQNAAFGYVALLVGGSVAALGVIGFLSTIPNLVLGLPAGPFVDRFNPRRLLLTLQTASLALSALLAALFATGSLTLPLMGALAVVGGSLGTLSFPAFHAMLASTVPRQDLESAVAINSLTLQCARFAGPAIGGALLATAGPTWVFSANAASYVAVILAVATLPGPRARSGPVREPLASAIKTGLRYVLGSRSISSLLALSMLIGLFAVPPLMFLLPALVRFVLHAGPGTLGALTSVIGLGSLMGALSLLRLSARSNTGEPIIAAYVLTAAGLVVVGISTSGALWAALAATGLASTVLAGLSTVTVIAATPEEMRARALTIWSVASAGVVPAGGLLTAALAGWLGVGGAVLLDGVALGAGGLLVLARRPEARWLGCTTLPVACIAGTDPAAVAEQRVTSTERVTTPPRVGVT